MLSVARLAAGLLPQGKLPDMKGVIPKDSYCTWIDATDERPRCAHASLLTLIDSHTVAPRYDGIGPH